MVAGLTRTAEPWDVFQQPLLQRVGDQPFRLATSRSVPDFAEPRPFVGFGVGVGPVARSLAIRSSAVADGDLIASVFTLGDWHCFTLRRAQKAARSAG